MRLYWTVSSIPELAHLPRRERSRLYHNYVAKAAEHWQVRATVIPFFLVIACVPLFMWIEDAKAAASAINVLAGVALIVVYFGQTVVTNNVIRPYLQQELGPTHCLRCGYDLRASKDRCPECGEAIPGEVGA